MRAIKRLLGVELGTPAFEQSIEFYASGFGLDARLSEDGQMVRFTAAAPACPVLSIARASRAELVGLTFAVNSEDDLRQAVLHLRARGCSIAEAHAPTGNAIRVADPDGRCLTLVVDAASVGEAGDASGRPLYLSHVVLNSPDVHRLTAFFVDALGFTIADRYENNLLTFLRCDQPQHHCIGVSPGSVPSLNHFSVDVGSIDGVMKGVGRMQKLGRQPIWGPGRHGPGGNVFCYFEDPSGFVAEFTCDVIQIDDEASWVAREWPRNAETGNVWGTGGPSARAIELMSGPLR